MERISGKYSLIITDKAQEDIREYIYTIRYTYDAPRTAKKHFYALYKVFETIQKNPGAYAVRFNPSLVENYGFNVRRANYKKMAIIYTINDATIYIHRVIAGSMITGL
jgi:plasmid stabilization system protein ParE